MHLSLLDAEGLASLTRQRPTPARACAGKTDTHRRGRKHHRRTRLEAEAPDVIWRNTTVRPHWRLRKFRRILLVKAGQVHEARPCNATADFASALRFPAAAAASGCRI